MFRADSDSTSLVTPLVVNAMGACTALAPTLQQTAFLLRRGSFAVRESAILLPDAQPASACALPLLDPYLVGPERLFALTELALGGLPKTFKERVSSLRLKVYPLLDQEYFGQLPNGQRRGDALGFALKARAENALHGSTPTEVTPRDATALAEILPQISADLNRGVADVALVVSAHSDLSPQRLSQLFQEQRLYSEDNDDGLLPGEAAVVLALSNPQTTRRCQLPGVARILAVHQAYDQARPDNDASAFDAVGLTFAFRRALEAAAVTRAGWLYSDLNFEHFRVKEYQAVLARCQDVMGPPQVHEFPGQRLGFLGCATVPMHVALAATAWAHGYGAAPTCLSLSGHDDGTRCGVVLAQGC